MDVVVSDFPKPIWRNEMLFDSIITDRKNSLVVTFWVCLWNQIEFIILAPYGIRETTERVENKERRPMKEENPDAVRYPSTSNYNLADIYGDLLKFSSKHLRLGGRLVCWIPIIK